MSTIRAFHLHPRVSTNSAGDFWAECPCGWTGPIHSSPADEHPAAGEGSRWAAWIDARAHFKDMTRARRDA